MASGGLPARSFGLGTPLREWLGGLGLALRQRSACAGIRRGMMVGFGAALGPLLNIDGVP